MKVIKKRFGGTRTCITTAQPTWPAGLSQRSNFTVLVPSEYGIPKFPILLNLGDFALRHRREQKEENWSSLETCNKSWYRERDASLEYRNSLYRDRSGWTVSAFNATTSLYAPGTRCPERVALDDVPLIVPLRVD